MELGIGRRIKQRRNELSLTQEELARRMGYKSKAAICKVENGEDNITSDRISKFANALQCSPGYLMGWEDGWAGEEKDETAPVFKVSDREPVVLSDDERDLIFKLRALDQKRRDTIMRLIDFLIKEVTDGNS